MFACHLSQGCVYQEWERTISRNMVQENLKIMDCFMADRFSGTLVNFAKFISF